MSTATDTTRPADPAPHTRPRRGGPPLIAPALAWAALTVAAAVVYPGVRPDADSASTLNALQTSATSAVSAVLLVASAVPLLVWSAAVHQRFVALGVRVAGPTIGLVGGILAAAALAGSGLATWIASTTAAEGDAALVHAFALLGFAAGGPLFATGLGLAIAGVAVPALILHLLPRGLAVAGLVVAAFGVVALLVLLVPVLGPVLPVVRFGGLLWLLAASLALPRTRRSVVATSAS